MDVWGQWLPNATLKVTQGNTTFPTTDKVSRIALNTAGTYRIELTAPDHEPIVLDFEFDGSDSVGGFARNTESAIAGGFALSREKRDVLDHGNKTVHTVYLGLNHKWFAPSGRPARVGNEIELLQDGENAFKRLATDMKAAEASIMTATWWFEGSFELERTLDPTEPAAARQKRTVQAIYDSSPATKRVMVNQFAAQDGSLSWITVDSTLRARGAAAGDKFEFLGQSNPTAGTFRYDPPAVSFADRVKAHRPHTAGREFDTTPPLTRSIAPRDINLTQWPVSLELPIASYHQKFHVIDERIAYIGGMNLRATDWDTSEHKVFDPRRMAFDASVASRQAVIEKSKTPDNGPRKDYMLRIVGPAVSDAKNVFATRWNYLRQQGVENADKATAVVSPVGLTADEAGGPQVQVTATMPGPFWEYAIAESWLRAVSQAESFIYIEDQYFRAPTLNAAIAARMRQVPGLQLVVITKPVNEWTDPGCAWTARTNTAFASEFPTRYHLFQLRSFDTAPSFGIDEVAGKFADIDVHAKMLIIDDKFMSVGSANKNDRGMVYEGELNAAVFDATWVKAQREKIITNILGAVPPSDWISALRAQAKQNDETRARWESEGNDLNLNGAPLPAGFTPAGFIYSLTFRPLDKCLVEGVGPDMT